MERNRPWPDFFIAMSSFLSILLSRLSDNIIAATGFEVHICGLFPLLIKNDQRLAWCIGVEIWSAEGVVATS